ncbi:MAG TPA: 1-phosphofructokinase [Clostridiales bacterium]|nr:1-phosphofructokinase [Clostridiales bacterium]
MIYTVTFNPAIDYVMFMKKLNIGQVNRTISEEVLYGGKGINVSIVLKNLGVDNVALGFLAGFTGDAIEQGVKTQGVKTDFVKLENGLSRINVKIKADAETDINGCGPNINEKALESLYSKLDKIKSGDYLVLAGSIPKTLPSDIYERILERLSGKGIFFIVDATKDLLLNVLKYKPFLVKPNNYELGEMFGKELTSEAEMVLYGRRLRDMGAKNVIISMAAHGAILIDDDDKVTKMGVPQGKVINSVGAGDSMVAGFIAGYLENGSYQYALRKGTAAGSATAFSQGVATKEKVDQLINKF